MACAQEVSHWTWAPCSYLIDRELLCSNVFRVKMWDHLSVSWRLAATRQYSKAQQQIYNRMTEKEKNQGVAMVQSKSRRQPEPKESSAGMKALQEWKLCRNESLRTSVTWSKAIKRVDQSSSITRRKCLTDCSSVENILKSDTWSLCHNTVVSFQHVRFSAIAPRTSFESRG